MESSFYCMILSKIVNVVYIVLSIVGFKFLIVHMHGPVVQKPINVNPRFKINQGVYFSTPKCCSTLIFGKTLHRRKSILKNKNKQKKLSPKS